MHYTTKTIELAVIFISFCVKILRFLELLAAILPRFRVSGRGTTKSSLIKMMLIQMNQLGHVAC